MKKKYQHIFFDLDRTLWHFEVNSYRVLVKIYEQFGLEKTIDNSSTFIEKYKEINESLWALYRENKVSKDELKGKRFSDTLAYFKIEDSKLGNEMGEYYVYHSPRQTELFPYTIEVLEYLKNKYELHIITNGFNEVQHIKLSESKIEAYFKEVILSETVGVKKPHPFIFKKAMKLAGAKIDNSIMIGDDWYADIYGASRVGMDSVYFNPNKTKHNNKVIKEISCLSELKGLL